MVDIISASIFIFIMMQRMYDYGIYKNISCRRILFFIQEYTMTLSRIILRIISDNLYQNNIEFQELWIKLLLVYTTG